MTAVRLRSRISEGAALANRCEALACREPRASINTGSLRAMVRLLTCLFKCLVECPFECPFECLFKERRLEVITG